MNLSQPRKPGRQLVQFNGSVPARQHGFFMGQALRPIEILCFRSDASEAKLPKSRIPILFTSGTFTTECWLFFAPVRAHRSAQLVSNILSEFGLDIAAIPARRPAVSAALCHRAPKIPCSPVRAGFGKHAL